MNSPFMPECPNPQSSAQGISYFPTLVGVNHSGIVRPRNHVLLHAGMRNEEAVNDVRPLERYEQLFVYGHVQLVVQYQIVLGADFLSSPG